jgi:hypothetical protein
MKALIKRGARLTVMTLGFAGLIISVNAIPSGATSGSGFTRSEVARGTYQSDGSLRLEEGLDIVVTMNTVSPGGYSGWHAHPGGAIVVVGCVPNADLSPCFSEITTFVPVGKHCRITPYHQGESFIERPGQTLMAKNKGTTTTIIYATFPNVPVGVLKGERIERDQPKHCPTPSDA